MKKLGALLLIITCWVINLKAEYYNSVQISYDNIQLFEKNVPVKDAVKLNGFGVNYLSGIDLGKLPMNIELGVKLNLGLYSHTDKYEIIKANYKIALLRLSIPLNYIYHFTLKNNIRIAPYLGFDFRLNILGKTKEMYEMGELTFCEENNMFEISPADKRWRRFQLGQHIGVRFGYLKWFFNIEYGIDYIKLQTDVNKILGVNTKNWINTGNLSLGLGCYF